MISDLAETIKQLLMKKGVFDPAEVDISFETPDRKWSASISKPTVNLYLYDIRENHELRSTDWVIEKDRNGIATRKKNPNRIDLSYLVSVWANDIDDEHHLLWRVLLTLFRYHELPEELLSGQLARQSYPIRTNTAQPDGLSKIPTNFWTTLGNELKPSISYVVTLPLDLDMAVTAPLVRTKVLEVKAPNTDEERLVQVAGIVHEAGKPTQGIPKAKVVAKEAGMTAETDAQGHYSFSKLSEGKHTFQVLVSGRKVQEASITIPSASYDLEV